MSIEKQEIEALEELEKLKQPPAEDKEKSEKLVDQVTQDVATQQDELPAEQEEKEPDETPEQEDAPDEEEEPKEEEELTGAKFRHKLKAEKEEKEKAQREVQEMKERLARLEGVQSVRQQQPQPEPEEDIPDEELEPGNYAIWKASKLEKELQVVRAQQQHQTAQHKWELMESEHSRTSKSYGSAKSFLLDAETKKIKRQYPSATDFQIREHLKEQEHTLVGKLASAGIDPLQHIEFLAHQQGFRQKDEVNTVTNKKKRITNINKNAAKNTSIIGGSPAGESARLTADQMLKMSYEEINKFGRDKYEEEIRKLGTG